MRLKAGTFETLSNEHNGRRVSLERYNGYYVLKVSEKNSYRICFLEEFSNFQEAVHCYRFISRTYHRILFIDEERGGVEIR